MLIKYQQKKPNKQLAFWISLLWVPFFGVYLGVRTCELFLCFVAFVRVRVYYVDFLLFSLFYVTGEFHRFLHRGRALFEVSVLHSHYLNKRTYNFQPHKKVHKL